MPRLVLARLAGAGVQFAIVDGQGEDVDGFTRPAAIGPFGSGAIVDAEVDVAVIGLTGRNAGTVLDGPVEAAPLDGVVEAEDVAEGVVEFIWDSKGAVNGAFRQTATGAESARVAVTTFTVAP